VRAGIGLALNAGLAMACGEYVAFLDDVDLYLPHKLERQYAGMGPACRFAM
jgi:glycosyltransferase involved in cell wall biosynthesis